MLTKPIRDAIMEWHQTAGGHQGRPAGHALRALRECVELCAAAGASLPEILTACSDQLMQCRNKKEFDLRAKPEDMAEECADILILLSVLADYNHLEVRPSVVEKIQVLKNRKWQADLDGVLWRPRN